MTQAAIRKLVADSVAAALEAQAATMANTDNTTRNTRQRETPIARKCSYKEFMNCQPFNFKGTEGAVVLIRCSEKLMEVFIRGLPRSIEGNVTASKPQYLRKPFADLTQRQNRRSRNGRAYAATLTENTVDHRPGMPKNKRAATRKQPTTCHMWTSSAMGVEKDIT
ncbi:hypothetical protein Tco_0324941 [Tanacetum coccineum]